MKVTYDFTPEDFTRLNQDYVKHDPDTQRRKRQSFWGVVLFCMLSSAGWLGFGDKVFAVISAITIVIWMCLYPKLWNYLTQCRIKKAIVEAQQTGYFGMHEASIGVEGVSTVTPRAKTEIKWSGISKVTAAEHGILLHTSSSTAILMPNSAFTPTNTREQFLEEMTRYREQAAGLTETL